MSQIYANIFQKHVAQYLSFNNHIKEKVLLILNDPYFQTESLQRELKGLRSARIGRNFRIVFAISEEIQKINIAKKRFPEFCGFSEETVIFITVGHHDKAYKLK